VALLSEPRAIGSHWQNNDWFPGKLDDPAARPARAGPTRASFQATVTPGTLLIQCRLHKTKKHTVPQAAEAATVIKVAGGTGST